MIFLESPWPILVFGILAEAILAVALLRSGRGALLWIMLGAAVVVGIGLLVERLVVTDRKRVAATIDGVAAALEANNVEAVLRYVSNSSPQLREEAQLRLSQVQLVHVQVRNLEVLINRLTSPPTAKATFNVFVTGRYRQGEFSEFGQQSRPGKLSVELDLEGDRWLITGYELIQDPQKL
ncbi:MAG: hypothetical protein ABSG68_19340 [Thermoguttaceae bacterium]|jgi:hypothetical protein